MYPKDDPELTDRTHILVIDGDDAVIETTRDQLEAAGYRVSIADLPDIGIVRRVEPDAIVVGISYRGDPGGIGFAEHHATDPFLARIPVVLRATETGLTPADQQRLDRLGNSVVTTTDEATLLNVLADLFAPVDR